MSRTHDCEHICMRAGISSLVRPHIRTTSCLLTKYYGFNPEVWLSCDGQCDRLVVSHTAIEPQTEHAVDAPRLQRGPRVLLAQAGALGDVHDQARGRRQSADAHVLQRRRERATPGADRDEQARPERLRWVRV